MTNTTYVTCDDCGFIFCITIEEGCFSFKCTHCGHGHFLYDSRGRLLGRYNGDVVEQQPPSRLVGIRGHRYKGWERNRHVNRPRTLTSPEADVAPEADVSLEADVGPEAAVSPWPY